MDKETYEALKRIMEFVKIDLKENNNVDTLFSNCMPEIRQVETWIDEAEIEEERSCVKCGKTSGLLEDEDICSTCAKERGRI